MTKLNIWNYNKVGEEEQRTDGLNREQFIFTLNLNAIKYQSKTEIVTFEKKGKTHCALAMRNQSHIKI